MHQVAEAGGRGSLGATGGPPYAVYSALSNGAPESPNMFYLHDHQQSIQIEDHQEKGKQPTQPRYPGTSNSQRPAVSQLSQVS